jgi:hypothetical protein
MTRIVTTSLAIVVLVVAGFASPGEVQAHSSGGHGYQSGAGMYFDPNSVVSMSGTIDQGFGNWRMRGHGNHTGGGMGFEFKAQGGDELELMVAPAWFLEENGIVLSNGERITVTGSLLDEYDNGNHHSGGSGHGGSGHGGMMGGQDGYLIATRIEADGVSLRLRDEEGYPLWRGGPDWAGRRWFDPDGVTTITGTLSELQGMWSSWGHGNHTGNGLHYIFDSDAGESFYAMVGPSWFMQGQGVKPADGKRVELRGSVVNSYWSKYNDHRFFVASEIKISDKTAQLRDDWGYPLWHGTGWHYFSPEWAKSSVQTLSGEVVKTRRRKHGRFLDKGYEVLLQSGGLSYTLYVTPHWDVKHMGLKLRNGDQIRVRGSMVRGGQGREMVVQYLEADGQRWHFRDSKGKPKWVKGAK